MRISLFLISFLVYINPSVFCQSKTFQQDLDSCNICDYSKNGKHDLEDLRDIRLKKMLKRFFILDEDTSQLDFNRYQMKYLDSMSVEYELRTNLPKDYEVRIQLRRFDKLIHKITYKNQGDEICQIDCKGFWGSDSNIPKYEISFIKVRFNNSIINIKPDQYNDIFFLYLNNWYTNALIDKKGEYFIFIVSGGDGSGSFVSIWIFKNGKYIGRVVNNMC